MGTSHRTADSSSVTPEELGQRFDSITKLGEKLIDELEANRVDLLARWQAHYIAEIIAAAETARPSDKKRSQASCAKEILRLWAHRQHLPGGFSLVTDFEPALKT